MKKNHKRISAAVLSLALGFSVAGAPALAPMAAAQQAVSTVSTVNPDAPASLTIEKYAGFPIAGPGEYQDSIDLPGLAAEFTVRQVTGPGLDLTTQAGWAKVNSLLARVDDETSAEQAITDEGLTLAEPGVTKTTAQEGGAGPYLAKFEDLSVGVYLVTESDVPGHQGADPFFVTLPYVETDGTGWKYDRKVQPKNQADTMPDKTVEDELAALGSTSTYTITMPIPDQADLSSIQVLDNLPDELNLVEDGEFGNVKVSVANGTETISFQNNSTLTALDLEITDGPSLDALRGETLVVKFDAVIVHEPGDEEASGGVIKNSASIDLEIGEVTYTYTTDPGEPTETRLGTLTINKQGYFDGDLGLIEGGTAEFELWRCTEQGEGPDVQWVLGAGPLEALVNEVPTTRFETTNGVAIINNVQMANFVNGKETPANDTLCVVEVQAPAGYVLNPEPQPVLEMDGDNFTMSVDVINLTDDGTGQLPSTGGQGTMAMIAGGLLVAVAGGFAALRGNRARG